MQHSTNKRLSPGSHQQLGATLAADGTNFALFSKDAHEVYLLLFDAPDAPPTDTIKIENKVDNIWHIFVHDIKAGQLYGYKVHGDYQPAQGLRFNQNKLLIDPYAKALTGQHPDPEHLLFAYDINAEQKDLAMDQRDDSALVPKSIVVDDAFDWQGDHKPNIPPHDRIVYEVHVKGFTAHPSSQVQHPGTYLGFIGKIPYLKSLGITSVELLPVHEFFVQGHILDKGLTNYWGYDTIGFFTPSSLYGTSRHLGDHVQEFKTMVKEMHKAGLEVILDVVFNHTAEGNQLGPTLCFKGIDNCSYYRLAQNAPEEPYRNYQNDTGCGNTLNLENPMVLRLVLDSLRYWTQVMHVDGFRFDLATVLGRIDGQFNKEAAFFKAIAEDPVLKDVHMIAEPWDLTTYQVGGFPKGWAEWNGKFRDTARRFIKGDEGQVPDLSRRLCGSTDLYKDQGREGWESVNFVTCHDGFTLYDLFSYNEKHNENNKEENKDGANDNFSWNCGAEGESKDFNVIELRKKMVKNAFCLLFFSCGTPMVSHGDELMRTKKGNNNTWCQDNDLSWLDWGLLQKNGEILEFFKKAITFRNHHSFLGVQMPEVRWFDKKLQDPAWDHPKLRTLCFQIQSGAETLFFVLNGHHRGSVVRLPEGLKWFRVIDTSRHAGDDFYLPGKEKVLRRQDKHYCDGRSIQVMLGKKI